MLVNVCDLGHVILDPHYIVAMRIKGDNVCESTIYIHTNYHSGNNAHGWVCLTHVPKP